MYINFCKLNEQVRYLDTEIGILIDFPKILSPVISELLCDLFNEIFRLGIFPDHMKIANAQQTE